VASVIACDLGTGSTKAALFHPDGHCVAQQVVPCRTEHPMAGHHEQRPQAWWASVLTAIAGLLGEANGAAADVGAIAVSGHSLGCVPLAADGALLAETVPIWSDSRAVEEAALFFQHVDQDAWYRTTGNGFPAPLYTLFKMMWLRRHRPEILARTHVIVGTKDFINYRLSGVIATDPSYASGLGAYDLLAGDYHDGLLAAAGFERSLLPEVRPAASVLGTIRPDVAARLGLKPTVRIVAGGVDNSCMALGANTYREGSVYSSMGSSSWLTVASARPLLDQRAHPYAFAHVVPGMFVSATSTFSSGTSLDWVARTLMENAGADEAAPYDDAMALAERSPAGANGLLFVPTLGGGTSLEGGPLVRGAFIGLDLKHDRADILRAALEGIALALRLALDELRAMTPVQPEMIMVGGGARSLLWRRIFANIFDCTILKTAVDRHAAALGAAALGFVGIGEWSDFARIDAQHVVEQRVEPDGSYAGLLDAALTAYRMAAEQQAAIAPQMAALRGAVA
jgi:xylulokinase